MHAPAWVPKGTWLGPWPFTVIIHNLKLLSNESLYIWKLADMSVSEIIRPAGSSSLQRAVEQISSWSNDNHLQLNPTQCKDLRSNFMRSPPSYTPVSLDDLEFETVSAAKVLGVTIGQDLKWNDHTSYNTAKAAKLLYIYIC